MTLRIPRMVLIVLGVVVLAGGLVAVYLTVIKSDEVCYSGNGDEVDCGEEGALSEAEYDEQQAQAAEAQRRKAQCESQVGHLLTDAQELNSRLNVGLPYAEYNTQVGNISVAYQEIDPGQLDADCGLDVAIHLEEALNSYVKADTAWNNCLIDFGCSLDSIDPVLQKHWADASANIEVAQHGLDHMGEPGPSEEEGLGL